MTDEITRTLEIINQGLEAMPEIGSETWKMMVEAIRVSNVISLVAYGIPPIVLLIIGVLFLKKAEKMEHYDDRTDFYMVISTITLIFGGVWLLGFIIFLPDTIRGIVYPAYNLLRQIMNSVGG